MRVYGQNITIHRGESFTVDFLLTNKDGSPFIVSSEMTHPYYLVSVVSNVYNTKNEYEYNVWCDLSKSYRFKDTHAVSKTGAINTWTAPSDYLDNIGVALDGLEYYNACVFYSTITKKYYVYKYTDDVTAAYVECDDINLNRLVLSFPTEVTQEWSGQNYTYSIRLVETEQAVTANTEEPVITSSIPVLSNGNIQVDESIGGNN